MIGRILALAATAVGGGLALGRRQIDRKIEAEIPKEIEIARERAVTELHKTLSRVISERLGSFLIDLVIKAGLVGAVYWLFAQGHLTFTGLKIVVGALIVGFIARDAFRLLPFALPAWRLMRQHGWNPKRAVTELVAGIAFERAYAQAMAAMETGPNARWIALSRYSVDNLSTQVADAVAEVARTVSFKKIKSRFFFALGTAAVMLLLYWSFFYLTVGRAALA